MMERHHISNSGVVLFAIVLGVSSAGTSGAQDKREEKRMPGTDNGLTFTVAQRGTPGPLLPEQAAAFDLRVRNTSAAPQKCLPLDGPMFTPVVRVYASSGKMLGEYSPAHKAERMVGDIARFAIPPAEPATIAPGRELTMWVNLWGFMNPLPPGRYAFEALHWITEGGQPLTSNRVPFEIVPAHVEASALSYDKPLRANSVLAWLAAQEKATEARLLVRISAFTSHAALQLGGTPQGEFPLHSRVALSAIPPDGVFPAVGWVAVISGNTLQLIQHNFGNPLWKAAPATLPMADATPVPRFPNRQHAVFLATGHGRDGGVLAGVLADRAQPSPKQWQVHLMAAPIHSACAFLMHGPITVLYSSDDGHRSRIMRLEIDESGAVQSAESVVRESANEVLAITADLRVEAQPSFFVLEADRARHDYIALVKVPLKGDAMATALRQVPNWPVVNENGGSRPYRPTEVALETDIRGVPSMALIDGQGRLLGGRAGAPLGLVDEPEHGRDLLPHIGAVAQSLTFSCFHSDGTLRYAGGGHVH